MIYEVEVSQQADSDLRGIFEYIAFELQSPKNASGQLDRLEKQILSLNTMPERYRRYEKEPWNNCIRSHSGCGRCGTCRTA